MTARQELFRRVVVEFLHEKLKGKEDDPGAAAKYEFTTWLADAARRVGQLQAVTHVAKATHPDARGSSLYVRPAYLPQHAEIGTHSLGDDFAEDVVGDAGALGVLKLLKLEVEGRRLLDWMRDGDPDLKKVLHADESTATSWMAAFAGLVRSERQPTSHAAAKQIYWLVGDDASDDGQFQLLQPLFSSSLAHAVHADIQDACFGDANKAARRAHRECEAHPETYRDYRNLVARKLGGSNPQNISQLNTERGGVNYLLSSLPPTWSSDRMKSLLGRETAFDAFAHFGDVHALVKELARFLMSNPASTMETRIYREQLEQELGQQLAVFGTNVHAHFGAGWTRKPECILPQVEKLWLDPERAEQEPREGHEEEDRRFVEEYACGDWADAVAGRFANWVNARLHAAGLTTLGDVEYKHWAKQAVLETSWAVPMQRRAPKVGAA